MSAYANTVDHECFKLNVYILHDLLSKTWKTTSIKISDMATLELMTWQLTNI